MKHAAKTADQLSPLGAFAAAILGAFAAAVAYLFATFATISYVDARHDAVLKILNAHGTALETMDSRLWDIQGRPKDAPPVRLQVSSEKEGGQ